jgi:transposase
MGNCRIHYSEAIIDNLELLLEAYNVRLIFLPKYSPELNPCEFVFGFIKRRIRDWRGSNSYAIEAARAISLIDQDNMVNWYRQCIRNI